MYYLILRICKIILFSKNVKMVIGNIDIIKLKYFCGENFPRLSNKFNDISSPNLCATKFDTQKEMHCGDRCIEWNN